MAEQKLKEEKLRGLQKLEETRQSERQMAEQKLEEERVIAEQKRQESIEEKAIEIAKNLLAIGIPIEQIAAITKLSISDIEQLVTKSTND
jgi:predicted transposase YdaD